MALVEAGFCRGLQSAGYGGGGGHDVIARRARVSTVTVTESPGRSFAASSAGTDTFTGTRCVILVKLPVAFSGGSRENSEPEAGARLIDVAFEHFAVQSINADFCLLARMQSRPTGFP